MNEYYIPINKGNYSMDTQERELEFEAKKGFGWEKEYKDYRSKWISHPKNKFVSDYPLLVDIELSSICNLKCPMCYTISEGFKEKVNTKRMDWDLFGQNPEWIWAAPESLPLEPFGWARDHWSLQEACWKRRLAGRRWLIFRG